MSETVSDTTNTTPAATPAEPAAHPSISSALKQLTAAVTAHVKGHTTSLSATAKSRLAPRPAQPAATGGTTAYLSLRAQMTRAAIGAAALLVLLLTVGHPLVSGLTGYITHATADQKVLVQHPDASTAGAVKTATSGTHK